MKHFDHNLNDKQMKAVEHVYSLDKTIMKPKLNSNLKKVTKQKVNRRHWLKNKSNITAKRNATKANTGSQQLEMIERQTEQYSLPEEHRLRHDEENNNQMVDTILDDKLNNVFVVESVDQSVSSDHSIASGDENNLDEESLHDCSEERFELDGRADSGTSAKKEEDLLERDYDELVMK